MWRVAVILALLAATAVTDAPVRSASFVYEDANAAWQHPGVLGKQPIELGRARWLTATSHRVVFTVFGPSPRASHLTNVALHMINGMLVYAIVGTWLAPAAAATAAGVFLLSPIQTEAVAYVASRSELLATAFALVAFWLSLKPLVWWRSALLWLAVVAAVSAKESAVVIVPLIALHDYIIGRRLSRGRVLALAVPALGIAASVIRFDFTTRTDADALGYMALQATAVWRYVGLTIVPYGLSVDHDFVVTPWIVQYAALTSGLLVATLMAFWAHAIGRENRQWRGEGWEREVGLVFGLTWTIVAVLPRFVVQIPELLNEHQWYFPMVGLSPVIVILGGAVLTLVANALRFTTAESADSLSL